MTMFMKSAAAALVAIPLVALRCDADDCVPVCFKTRDELVDAIQLFFYPPVLAYYGDVEDWCFESSLKDMSFLGFPSDFDVDIGGWDVSNVEDMSGTFADAIAFNRALNEWNVARVTSMTRMFHNASSFDQPIWKWDVSKVKRMVSMFRGARKFNRHIGGWNVSRVTSMAHMFDGATDFNKPIGAWDVSRVFTMSSMFLGATQYDQGMNNWDVSRVDLIHDMFKGATSFNRPLNKWNVAKMVEMDGAFQDSGFNQSLCDWGEHMIYPPGVKDMFQGSKCPFKSSPTFQLLPISPLCYACELCLAPMDC